MNMYCAFRMWNSKSYLDIIIILVSGIFRENNIGIVSAGALAACVTKPPTDLVLTI